MTDSLNNVIYKSAIMQQLRKELEPFVQSASPILFWGEPGSGMGYYAKALHDTSRTGDFLKISCSLLDESTVRQQFLGNDNQRGWLEKAHNGTILLKRITETTPAIQQILSHFLGIQSVDGRLEFSRTGGTESLQVNVRFLFSMVHDLDIAIQDGLVPHELVDVIRKRGKILHLPPLRERKEDILRIAENLLEEYNQEYQQSISAFDKKVQKLLTKYLWPENIDELKRMLRGIFSQYQGITTITEQHLPDYIVKPPKTAGDKYIFKLKDGQGFTGTFVSHSLRVQREQAKFKIHTRDVIEILRVEDDQFVPPRLKHFLFKLKDGDKVTGLIQDNTISIKTAFDASHKINVNDLDSVVLC